MSVELVDDNTHGAQQPSLDMAMPVARIRGEAMTDLPADLFIPPDALSIILDEFEGPLDLLLYLIRRHSLDILDIPMADLTRQYMVYVEAMREGQLELAAEYLLMAALLIEIKSRMLLPRPPRESDAEPEDPRAELVRRLLEYERIKLAAAAVHALPHLGRDFLKAEVSIEQSLQVRFPEVNVVDLQEAWSAVLQRVKLVQHHRITRAELSVREHMGLVLKKLQGRRFVEFADLFDAAKGTSVLIVTFIALLELAKEALIEITQAEVFAPLYVRLAYSPT